MPSPSTFHDLPVSSRCKRLLRRERHRSRDTHPKEIEYSCHPATTAPHQPRWQLKSACALRSPCPPCHQNQQSKPAIPPLSLRETQNAFRPAPSVGGLHPDPG